jgi:hypothetical protein
MPLAIIIHEEVPARIPAMRVATSDWRTACGS